MMFVMKGQDILAARDPWTEREVEEISLDDGEKLVASGDLDSDQLYQYLQGVPSWDEEAVEPAARELCDRFGVNYDDYENMDDLMPKLWEAMVEYVEKEASCDFMCDVMLEGGYVADMSLEYAEEQLRAHRAVDYRVPILPEEYRKEYNEMYSDQDNEFVRMWKPREVK